MGSNNNKYTCIFKGILLDLIHSILRNFNRTPRPKIALIFNRFLKESNLRQLLGKFEGLSRPQKLRFFSTRPSDLGFWGIFEDMISTNSVQTFWRSPKLANRLGFLSDFRRCHIDQLLEIWRGLQCPFGNCLELFGYSIHVSFSSRAFLKFFKNCKFIVLFGGSKNSSLLSSLGPPKFL